MPTRGLLLPRGVYGERVLSADGDPIYLAVDSQHRQVARRAIQPHERPEDVERELWRLLDAADPLPLAAAS